uniref:cytidine monophosphate-N-acetylneuraminic acid hydroxylase-like n=1 Tax=Gasterosteus aculeatus aculeatus TaxID=481459 RepID=UPI001A99F5B0|nr:cytidine monophosphate-N-acetylneuraminic acid hydroxylase-like [Gasterosteus aculeatus aculeatus]
MDAQAGCCAGPWPGSERPHQQMIETDDNFEPHADGSDFLDLTFPTKRPEREHAYIEIKNRIGVMKYVVQQGLLWDDLYIGFQNRIRRDPDVYHHKFWNHFQTQLPVRRPDWDQFLQEISLQEPDTAARGQGANCVTS